MEDINISFSRPEENPEISVIKVNGYVDTTTSAELEESLKRVLKKGTFKVIMDLGGVNYISSAGWGIFISEIKNIRENGGDLKLAAMVPDVYEVFELLEFQTILECFDSVDDAVRSFDRQAGSKSANPGAGEVEESVKIESSADAKIKP
jgi:anti-anti-sigma factor